MKKMPKKSIILTSLTGVILICSYGYVFDKSSAACASTDDYFKAKISKGTLLDSDNSLIVKHNLQPLKLDKMYLSDYFVDDIYYTPLLRLDRRKDFSYLSSNKPYLNNQKSDNIYNISLSQMHKTSSVNKISLSNQQSPVAMMSMGSIKQENNINSSIKKAKYLIKQGDRIEAEKILLKTVDSTNNSWILAEIAGILESINRFSKADYIYQKALSSSPNRIEILLNRAMCLYKGNYLDNAEKVLQKILSINPEFMLAHYNLGNIYYQKGQYYKALESFNKAIQLNPLSSDSYYNIGLILENINRRPLALKYYKKCIEINSYDIQAQKAVKKLTQKV